MAYLDLDLAVGSGSPIKPSGAVRLEELEYQAVLASRGDDVRSLRASGRIDRVEALLFGARPARSLANERLEAIRRYAVLYRLSGSNLARAEMAAAQAAGISSAKLALVRSVVDRWRIPAVDKRLPSDVTLIALASAIGFPLHAWLSEETGDGLIALIVVLVGLTTVIAMVRPRNTSR